MITIKNKTALRKMAHAGSLLADMFQELTLQIKPGVTTGVLDAFVADSLTRNGLVSRTKGYKGYRHVSCISINDEVVHGIPRADRALCDGDIVSIDVCASYNGYCADMARTVCVGSVADPARALCKAVRAALDKGIEQARTGNHLSDVSAAIQQEAERHGFAVVRDFAGHGIGKYMHEDPEVLNYGSPGNGPLLREGMTFALEPMITNGSYKVFIDHDGWTVRTVDGSLAAHMEDTIVVTDDKPLVLTRKLGISREDA
jgi:methionyl aminopeptidase